MHVNACIDLARQALAKGDVKIILPWVAASHEGEIRKAFDLTMAVPGGEMVGTAGFEPATLCSQSRCATRLRYVPTLVRPPKYKRKRPASKSN